MGIYALNKSVIQLIPANSQFDLPDLIKKLLMNGEDVYSYNKDYFWLDIGRVEDYEEATLIFEQRKSEFVKYTL